MAVPATVAAADFDLQGHRGARGLAPENTLPDFARALSLGVNTLEFDTGVTKDGEVVIAHDRRLNPDITRGPDGAFLAALGPAIHDLTLAELKTYDIGGIRPGTAYAKLFPEQVAVPGTRFPTLAELADLVRRAGASHVRFNVETKLSPLAPEETPDPETFAAKLVAALRDAGIAGRAMIQSFDWRTLQVVQKIAPDIPTVYLTQERGQGANIKRGETTPWVAGFRIEDHGDSVPRMVKAAGGKFWSPLWRDVTDQSLAEAKALGLPVVVWTVNDPVEMRRLIERGVDGIISDRPDLLRAVVAEMGLKLPTPTPVTP
ncbi:MAG: glycerophosphodiester phosphodiesterase [Proteobacteria bacterium]|nr:glycerophosphodiester phosphodiesterase [Pseudomonadota bacterium]